MPPAQQAPTEEPRPRRHTWFGITAVRFAVLLAAGVVVVLCTTQWDRGSAWHCGRLRTTRMFTATSRRSAPRSKVTCGKCPWTIFGGSYGVSNICRISLRLNLGRRPWPRRQPTENRPVQWKGGLGGVANPNGSLALPRRVGARPLVWRPPTALRFRLPPTIDKRRLKTRVCRGLPDFLQRRGLSIKYR